PELIQKLASLYYLFEDDKIWKCYLSLFHIYFTKGCSNYAESYFLHPSKGAFYISTADLPLGKKDLLSHFSAFQIENTDISQAIGARLLSIRNSKKERLGSEHPEVISVDLQLVEIYLNQGRFEEAEILIQDALRTRKRQLGDTHFEVLDVMKTLAALRDKQERYEEAEALFIQVLAHEEKEVSVSDNNMLLARYCMARFYFRRRRYRDSEQQFKKVIELIKRRSGDLPILAINCLINLGEVYFEQGHIDEGKQFIIQALDLNKQLHLGPNTTRENVIHAVDIMSLVTSLYIGVECFSEAEFLLREGLDIMIQNFPEDHCCIGFSLEKLANFLVLQGHYLEATLLYCRVFRIYKSDNEVNITAIPVIRARWENAQLHLLATTLQLLQRNALIGITFFRQFSPLLS
ncbi:MAG: tetratricopeptide repeat protein, partial [Bacteroidota bacterium]